MQEPVDLWETVKDSAGETILSKFYRDPRHLFLPFPSDGTTHITYGGGGHSMMVYNCTVHNHLFFYILFWEISTPLLRMSVPLYNEYLVLVASKLRMMSSWDNAALYK